MSTDNGTITLTMVTPRLETDAEHDVIHAAVASALQSVGQAMRRIRALIPSAIRAEGINYIYDFTADG